MTVLGIGRRASSLAPLATAAAVLLVPPTLFWLLRPSLTIGPLAILLFAIDILLIGGAYSLGRRTARPPFGSATSIEEAVGLALTRREEGRVVFELVEEGIIVAGHDLTIEAVNPAAQRILGLTGPPEGRPWREAVPLLDSEGQPLVGSADPFARAVASRRKGEAAALAQRTDGAMVPVHVTVLPIEGALTAQRRYVAVIRDRSASASRFRATTQMIAQVVHDLRTPVTSLQALIELAARETDRPETQQRLLGLLRSESEQLGRIVEEILDTTSIQLGKARVNCSDVRVSSLVDAVLAPFRAADTHLIDMTYADAPSSLHADAPKLSRALTNLVANAIKYTPPGSTVSVRVSAHGPSGAAFAIADNGPGIPREDQGRIFEPFFRGSRQEQAGSDIPGTGLGLTTVRDIARLHSGDVAVGDAPGGGALFTLTIGAPACAHGSAVAAQ